MDSFGKYVDNSDDECDIEQVAEPYEGYVSGRFCPISLGQMLHDGRYQVVHKLGHGGFSTVWLARDLLDNGRVVALKVCTQDAHVDELDIQQRILNRVPAPVGLVTHQGHFQLHKTYSVLVYPVRGPNLRRTIYRLPAATRMAAAQHLLYAIKELHDAGFVHRDITLGNVLWHIDPIDQWTTEKVYQAFGRPQKVRLANNLAVSGDLVAPVEIPYDLLAPRVYLSDFGQTIAAEDRVEGNYYASPLAFCAPERFHGHRPSFASDMWSYSIVFASLLVGFEVTWGNDIDQIVALAGRFPKDWRTKFAITDCQAEERWYDDTLPMSQFLESLEKKIDRADGDVPSAVKDSALRLLRRGLAYDPEQRITATEMLQDRDFHDIMSYYHQA